MNPGHMAYLVDRNARKYPTKTALCGEGERWSYLRLKEEVLKVAGGLKSLGLRRGDRVCTLMLNRIELVAAYLAIFRLGAILVPLNTRLADPEWQYILNDSQARFLLTEESFVHRVAPLRDTVATLEQVVCVGSEAQGVISWEKLRLHEPLEEPPEEPDIEGDLYILYTSGTTGRPKGAVITHQNFLWNAINAQVSGGFSGDDVVYYGLPLFHAAAMGGCFATLLLGGTVVLRTRFDPEELAELIETERITRFPAVPPMVLSFLEVIDLGQWDLSSLRYINMGATIIPQTLKERLLKRFPSVELTDSYGLTEATSYCTILRGRECIQRAACVGRPHAYVEVRVVDDEGRDLPPGEVGEVLIRGPNVMKGYWNMPEATKETLRNGWLHTGDLGRIDGDGYLYIVDRKKDMIISGGENVYPREVEEVLSQHPDVLEACVVGLPDERWGERVVAYIVPAHGSTPSIEELHGFCKCRLASYKCPKEYRFVEELPRTSTGKVLKRVLRDQATKEGLPGQ